MTDHYADVRASLLIDAVGRVPELAQRLEDATRTLKLMTGIYAQSARTAATHRRHPIERREQLPKAPSPARRKR